MKRILITGANSYVGTNVERWLLKEPDKYHVDTIDMVDGSWKEKSFSSYDVVFHVAGIAHVNAKKKLESLYYKINRDLAIETAEKAKADGVGQFIFMSSMIVYGESKSLKPVIITKDTIPQPNGFYGDSKLQAEMGIRELEEKTFKVAILRPPMIYGPGSKGNFLRLVTFAKKSPIFPAFANKRSMLYIDNLSEVIQIIARNKMSGIFTPQNKEYGSSVEIVRQVAKANNHFIWITRFLNPIIKISAPFISIVPKVWGTFAYAHEMNFEKEGYSSSVTFTESIDRTMNDGVSRSL